MRSVIFNCESTGLSPEQGHRLIGIACLEMVDGQLTGRLFHSWLNPAPARMDDDVMDITGIQNEFLKDKPRFADMASELLEFLDGAQLVIHHATYDLAFLRHEFQLAGIDPDWIESHCTVLDTYEMAKQLFPGQRNTLHALFERFELTVDESLWSGLLKDAAILADVLLKLSLWNK